MSPYFKMNLDIGHFFAAGYDPVEYLQEHHQDIIILHLKDRKRPENGANLPVGRRRHADQTRARPAEEEQVADSRQHRIRIRQAGAWIRWRK